MEGDYRKVGIDFFVDERPLCSFVAGNVPRLVVCCKYLEYIRCSTLGYCLGPILRSG